MKTIFIGGPGRSGTTLLQTLIGTHPRIITLEETSILRRVLLRYKNKKIIFDKLRTNKRFERLDIKLDDLIKKSNSFENIWDLIIFNKMSSLNIKDENIYICEKDPLLVFHTSKLSKLNPNSYFLFIYREPKDIISSRKKANWSSSNSLIKHCLATLLSFLCGVIGCKIFYRNKHIIIKYEDLITNEINVVNNIFDKLMLYNLNEDDINKFTDVASKLISIDELQWKNNNLLSIKRNNTKKWKNSLTFIDRIVIDILCLPIILYGNYDL